MQPDDLRAVRTIVTHAECPDGIASALILHDALPDADVLFVEHNTPEQRELNATPGMLFCDIAPTRDQLQAFVDAGAIVLDHHKAARDVVAAFGSRGAFADEREDPGVSGALLAYREVWQPLRSPSQSDSKDRAILRFAELAGVRDTWQTEHAAWDEACAQATALTFYGYERLVTDGATLSPAKLETGKLLIEKRLATAKEVAQRKTHRIANDMVIFNDRDRVLSDVAHFALQNDSDIQIVCGFHYKVLSDGNMLLVMALRSRKGGVDVSAIAKRHGGGGHSTAAGFSVAVDGHADPIAAARRTVLR